MNWRDQNPRTGTEVRKSRRRIGAPKKKDHNTATSESQALRCVRKKKKKETGFKRASCVIKGHWLSLWDVGHVVLPHPSLPPPPSPPYMYI
jgi:NADPH-dependent ferric siderophore reductase